MQTALRLRAEGKSSLHQELKLSRRKQRETLQRSHSEPIGDEAPQHSAPEQQGQTESLEQHIESIIQVTDGEQDKTVCVKQILICLIFLKWAVYNIAVVFNQGASANF